MTWATLCRITSTPCLLILDSGCRLIRTSGFGKQQINWRNPVAPGPARASSRPDKDDHGLPVKSGRVAQVT